MTFDEIRALPAGRELDVLVHRRVMGRECKLFKPTPGEFGIDLNGWYDWPQTDMLPEPVPRYSEYIAAAWLVLKSLHWQWEIGYDPAGWGTVEIAVWRGGEEDGDWDRIRTTFECLDDLSVAICRAALATTEP